MRHPHKFSRALGVSYSITFAVDLSMGIIGYLMFGKYVLEEITQSILGTKGYPLILNYLVNFLRSINAGRLHYRCDTNNKNASQHSSYKYNARYLTGADYLIIALNHFFSPTYSTRPLPCVNSSCDSRSAGDNSNYIPRLRSDNCIFGKRNVYCHLCYSADMLLLQDPWQ
jgi:hypothetical protein